jgi:hypothetical protein
VLLNGGERDQLGAVGRWPYIASHAAISNASDATGVALARAKSSAAYGACRAGREEAAGGQRSGTALPGPDDATDGKQRGYSGAGDADRGALAHRLFPGGTLAMVVFSWGTDTG